MSNFLDRLNLRPLERRIVIGAAIVVFAVVNVVWVWPHFKDWNRIRYDFLKARNTLQTFKNEIAQKPTYTTRLGELEKEGGARLPEEASVQLRRDIQNQASQSGLGLPNVNDLPRAASRPDQLFDEHSARVTVTTGDKELIDFLYNISKEKSMIRVKDLNVRPDPQQLRLLCDITLGASYQKKAPSKVAPPPAAKPGTPPAAAKPATPPGPTASSAKPVKPDSARVER